MTLEAFFNDYAAKKLGDKFFYENFEILRPMGKLQLIAKFILKADVVKGTTLWNLADSLFRERNKYVHSKSEDGHDLGMTEDEYKEFLAFVETDEGKGFLSQPSEVDMAKGIRQSVNLRKRIIAAIKITSLTAIFIDYDHLILPTIPAEKADLIKSFNHVYSLNYYEFWNPNPGYCTYMHGFSKGKTERSILPEI